MKTSRGIIVFVALVAIGLSIWAFRDRLPWLQALPKLGTLAERKTTDAIQQIAKGISAPPPLRVTQPAAKPTTLSVAGVLQWTNANRADGGLAALTINVRLTAAAQAKLKDMFAKQYFEHVSPTGVGPGDLATQAGYAFVVEGENLALGDFGSDKGLLDAWMNSPGHRANIMNASYTQIGIAVGKGVYEGQTTWLAVQEFGKPLSDCPPMPSADLKARIDTEETYLNGLNAQAAQLQAEIESLGRPRTRKEADAYNAKVDAYNALIRQINAYTDELKQLIAGYNAQVKAFNACTGS